MEKIKTGVDFIDTLTKGVNKSDVNILGSTFGQGKTITMINISKSIIENGKNVLYITFDDRFKTLQIKLCKLISESENIDKDKIYDYIDKHQKNKLILRKVDSNHNHNDNDNDKLIELINSKDDFDFIVIDGYYKGKFEDFKFINESVKPILFFTTMLDSDSLNNQTEINYDGLNVFNLKLIDRVDSVKIFDMYFNGKIANKLTIDFNTFKFKYGKN